MPQSLLGHRRCADSWRLVIRGTPMTRGLIVPEVKPFIPLTVAATPCIVGEEAAVSLDECVPERKPGWVAPLQIIIRPFQPPLCTGSFLWLEARVVQPCSYFSKVGHHLLPPLPQPGLFFEEPK